MHQHLSYDPITGHLTWLHRRNGRMPAGSRAGSLDKLGYIVVRFDRVQYGAHRIAWLLTHGEWPEADIDHINGVRHDNRLVNLRSVSRAVNLQNQRRAHRDNKADFLGVTAVGRRFMARIMRNGVLQHLGTFDTAIEASENYQRAKQKFHHGG